MEPPLETYEIAYLVAAKLRNLTFKEDFLACKSSLVEIDRCAGAFDPLARSKIMDMPVGPLGLGETMVQLKLRQLNFPRLVNDFISKCNEDLILKFNSKINYKVAKDFLADCDNVQIQINTSPNLSE